MSEEEVLRKRRKYIYEPDIQITRKTSSSAKKVERASFQKRTSITESTKSINMIE